MKYLITFLFLTVSAAAQTTGQYLFQRVDANRFVNQFVTPQNGQYLRWVNGQISSGSPSGSGTVTSVALTAPTGFTVGGSPVTGSGTLALGYAAGFQGFTNAQASLIASALQPGAVIPWGDVSGKPAFGTMALETATNYLTTAAAATTYQPLDAQLTDLAGLSYAGNSLKVIRVNAGGTGFELATITSGGASPAGSGSELQYRVDGSTFGAVTGSSVSGGNITLGSGTITASNLSGTNTGDQTITLTGDVTGSGTGSFAATIANDAVTFAKLQNISSDHLIGRHSSGSGDPQQIGVGGGLAMSGANLERAALTGDVTASAGSNTTTIANGAVTDAKLASTLDLSAKTLTLPSDVTRLGSSIDLTSEVTGTLPIANGGTGQTTAVAAFDALAPSTTKGDLIVHNGTDNIRVPVGTDGHSLVADSTQASGVKWAAGGGGSSGAMVLLASATASNSAEILFDNEFDPTLYSAYKLVVSEMTVATNEVTFRLAWRNSTPADITGTYRFVGYLGLLSAAGSGQQANQNNADSFILSGGGTANIGNGSGRELAMTADIIIGNELQNITWRCIYRYGTSTIIASYDGLGALDTTTDVKGLRLFLSSGNITAGNFQLYGIKK